VKLSTNKDVFAPFGIETLSDAFCSVELKKLNREIQREKQRLRREKLHAILGTSASHSTHDGPCERRLTKFASVQEFTEAENEPESPYRKSKTKGFADSDNGPFERLPVVLRKTSTMKNGELHSSKEGFHSKNGLRVHDSKKQMTDQELVSSIQKISSHENEKEVRNDDSRSLSIDSLSSIGSQRRAELRKAIDEHEKVKSNASTIDFGISHNGSKPSLYHKKANASGIGKFRNNSMSPSPSQKGLIRKRTLGCSSLKQTFSENIIENGIAVIESIDGIDANLRPPRVERNGPTRSNCSHSSKLELSQKWTSERDQKIFDVYMKTPYRLMDNSKQRRVDNRRILKLSLNRSASNLLLESSIHSGSLKLRDSFSNRKLRPTPLKKSAKKEAAMRTIELTEVVEPLTAQNSESNSRLGTLRHSQQGLMRRSFKPHFTDNSRMISPKMLQVMRETFMP